MAYIGQSIKNGTFSVLDTSGNTYNGSNVTFSLGTQVGSAAQLLVSHDGVIQKPGTDYTLATGGTQITFTTAPASGASIFIVEISGAVGGPINSDLNGNELVLDVDGDTSIAADTDDQIDLKAGGTDTMHIVNGDVRVGTPTSFGPMDNGLKVKGDVTIGDFTADSGSSTLAFIKSRNTTVGSQTTVNNGDEIGAISFRADDGDDSTYNNNVARIAVGIDDTPATNDTPGLMKFEVTADGARTTSEAMRIGSSGIVLINTTSATINASSFGTKITNGLLSTSGNVNGGSTVTESFGNAGQIRFMGDGDAENTNNSYGALSDRTLKENETSASSQWDDIKALQIKNYNLIEYPDRPQIGVIAQDLESAGMTGLVKTDDEGLKSVKYSVLYMKAVKALQEAITKIETLETEMTALKARVTTLEG
jgi:hypothetical protein